MRICIYENRYIILGKRCCRDVYREKGEVQACMDRIINIIAKVVSVQFVVVWTLYVE